MPTTFLSEAYFLQALGVALLKSLYQAAVCWLIYHSITKNRKQLSARHNYQLAYFALTTCFMWFVITLLQYYQELKYASGAIRSTNWIAIFKWEILFPVVAIYYCLRLIYLLIQFKKHYNKLHFIRSHGLLAVSLSIENFVKNNAILLTINRTILVKHSPNIEVPTVIGWLKPIILLPVALLNYLTIEQVNAILIHELAHIKRNDYLLNLLQTVMVTLLSINPFVRFLNHAINKQREDSCDDLVIKHQQNAFEYAKALLILEEHRQHYLPLAIAATNNKKNLLQRIKRICSGKTPLSTRSFWPKSWFAGSIGLILLGSIFLNPAMVTKPLFLNITPQLPYFKKEIVANKLLPVAAPAMVKAFSSTQKIKRITSKQRFLKAKIKAKSLQPVSSNEDFVVALVNEDALKITREPLQIKAISTNKIEADSLDNMVIKIEEVRSGSNETDTYYLKLNNEHGKSVIKPLLIIRKHQINHQQKRVSIPLLNTHGKIKSRIST